MFYNLFGHKPFFTLYNYIKQLETYLGMKAFIEITTWKCWEKKTFYYKQKMFVKIYTWRLTSTSSSTMGRAAKVSSLSLDYKREKWKDTYMKLATGKDSKILNKDKGKVRDNILSSWKGQRELGEKSFSCCYKSC